MCLNLIRNLHSTLPEAQQELWNHFNLNNEEGVYKVEKFLSDKDIKDIMKKLVAMNCLPIIVAK